MKRRRLALALLLLAVVAGVVVVVVTRQRQTAAPEPARVGDWIDVSFTTPQGQGRRPPSGAPGRLDERLVDTIDSAQRSIDMAVYDFDLESVAEALVRAQRRGVRVRLVTDTDNFKNAAVEEVRAAGVPVVGDNRGPIMHHKFAVFDEASVLTGSWNFTANDTFQYNNNTALIRSRELAENYTNEFEKMFTERKFGPTKRKDVPHPRIEVGGATIETVFESEGDAPSRIVARIRGARDSVVFMAFTFTDDRIGQAMEERYHAGVKVRGVFEQLQSDRPESELARFRAAGMDTQQPAGFPRKDCVAGPGVLTDGNPQLMHHKVIVIDGQTVIFGSFNFTRNAAEDNDENLLIIDDPAVAGLFLAEFCRVYDTAVERAKK